jgi:hypothetical protein
VSLPAGNEQHQSGMQQRQITHAGHVSVGIGTLSDLALRDGTAGIKEDPNSRIAGEYRLAVISRTRPSRLYPTHLNGRLRETKQDPSNCRISDAHLHFREQA